MEISKLISRLNIVLIGCSDFEDETFDPLYGVEKDLNLIKELLIEGSQSLFSEIKPTILINPSTQEVRSFLTNYVYTRSAEQDYLIIYYSGHGAIVNGNQFAFVFKDSRNYPIYETIIPSSVLTSNEIFNTLNISKSIPIMVIDACHSALINPKSPIGNTLTTMDNLRDNIHSIFASDFMLFCACAESEVTPETSLGGYFSSKISQISKIGDIRNQRKPILTINDVYKLIVSQKLSEPTLGVEPRLFFGHGVSDFPFIKNKLYKPIIIKLCNYHLETLELLWSKGNPIPLMISTLDEKLGKGAYANYSKLAYDPWKLIEKQKKIIKLSVQGLDFMNNKIRIPEVIYKDETTSDKYQPHPEYQEKFFYEYRAQMNLFDFDEVSS